MIIYCPQCGAEKECGTIRERKCGNCGHTGLMVKLTSTCRRCGKTFQIISKSAHARAQYCSDRCKNDTDRIQGIECLMCKKIFTPGSIGNIRNKDCPECGAKKSLRYKIKHKCLGCGKDFIFYGTNTNADRLYCSQKCSKDSDRTLIRKIEIPSRVLDMVEQEIMVNGEEIFIKALRIGLAYLFPRNNADIDLFKELDISL